MIDKLKVFEKSFQEFVEWMTKETDWIFDMVYDNFVESEYQTHINFRELRSLLIEFLDSKGIYVETRHYPSIRKGDKKIYWHWLIKSELSPEEFSSRPEAEEQGIIKGIEIYNNQKEK